MTKIEARRKKVVKKVVKRVKGKERTIQKRIASKEPLSTDSQEQLYLKYAPSENDVLGREASPKDFNWKVLRLKNVWDGLPGVYRTVDPTLKYIDYPLDYITDPITGIKMQRVVSYDKFCSEHEVMYKVIRDKDTLPKGVLPVEYYSVFNYPPKWLVAVSAGNDGMSFVDEEKTTNNIPTPTPKRKKVSKKK